MDAQGLRRLRSRVCLHLHPARSRPARSRPARSRLAALVLLGALAQAAAGCGGSAATPQTIYTTLPATPSAGSATTVSASPSASAPSSAGVPTAAAPTPSVAPAAAPTVSATVITTEAADHRWSANFREPVVAGAADVSVAAMNNSISTRVNSYISSFTESELPVVAAGDGPSTLNGDFSVALASPTLLSLRFTIETFASGAAHPSTDVGSINFDVGSGGVIQISDLFASPAAALPILQAQAHSRLTALLGRELAWPASVTMADFGKAWVFSAAGLELTWAQGEIAATAAGTPRVVIPWAALPSVIASPGPAAGFIS